MLDVNEIKRKSVAGVIGYFLRTIVLQLIGLVATALLGLYLSPADFGIYFIVTAVVSLFTFLSDVGLAAALVQKKDEPSLTELRTTFTVQQSLAFGIFALIVFLTPIWRTQQGLGAEGLGLLYALAFSFVLASLKTIPSILLERKLEFNKLVFPQILENLAFYVIAVLLARSGYGIRSYTIAVLARSTIGVASIYAIQRWPMGFAFSKTALGSLLRFGVKFQLNDFLARLKDDLFIVVLARFLPAAQMGYVSFAKRWSMFPYQFSVNSVMAVTFPTFSRLQEHPEKLKRAIEKSLYFITLLIFPILGGAAMMMYPLLHVFEGYQKWLPALPAFAFFCINIAFAAVSSPLTNALNAIGKINSTLKLMTMWLVLTWTVTPLGVIQFGFTGVAVASAFISLTSVVTVFMVKKVVNIEVIRHIGKQALASVVMIGALLVFRDIWARSFVHVLAGVVFGGGVFGAAFLLVGYRQFVREVRSLFVR